MMLATIITAAAVKLTTSKIVIAPAPPGGEDLATAWQPPGDRCQPDPWRPGNRYI
jgi:hypothetical protein